MSEFEIHDDKGVLYKGSLVEIMHIWGCLWKSSNFEEAYCENYKEKIPFKKWNGSLRIVAIIDSAYLKPGKHTVQEVFDFGNKRKFIFPPLE
jgi:hypothetical protein